MGIIVDWSYDQRRFSLRKRILFHSTTAVKSLKIETMLLIGIAVHFVMLRAKRCSILPHSFHYAGSTTRALFGTTQPSFVQSLNANIDKIPRGLLGSLGKNVL